MAREFVIHEHIGCSETHYDLMLSCGEALATWQLPQRPMDLAVGGQLPAQKLPDHRTAYLTYEGPVSGGRGHVRNLDAGCYELLAESPDRWEVRFAGRDLIGTWELVRTAPAGEGWTLRRLTDD